MEIRPNTDVASHERLRVCWYRDELRERALPSLEKWQAHLGVKASALYVRRMKTKWGSCNPHSGNIRLNTDLAKKPVECLDYVILHELAHLRVRLHTLEFFSLLDYALPQRRETGKCLTCCH
jgi:predicted metal-dependent hydrolase